MAKLITINIDGRPVSVPAGINVAAALALVRMAAARRTVTGALRAPLCGMGVCHECRVSIDGRRHSLACQTLCQPGMQVLTDLGGEAP